MKIERKGYTSVECDCPLPCPFCGSEAELAQLAHATSGACIVASSEVLAADTFWFRCTSCKATTGRHQTTAQDAVSAWNRRNPYVCSDCPTSPEADGQPPSVGNLRSKQNV